MKKLALIFALFALAACSEPEIQPDFPIESDAAQQNDKAATDSQKDLK